MVLEKFTGNLPKPHTLYKLNSKWIIVKSETSRIKHVRKSLKAEAGGIIFRNNANHDAYKKKKLIKRTSLKLKIFSLQMTLLSRYKDYIISVNDTWQIIRI